MTQPIPYQPAVDFSAQVTLDRNLLDTELGKVQATTDQIRASIAQMQRDDGAPVNGWIGRDALATEVYQLMVQGINPRGLWVAATTYKLRDYVRAPAPDNKNYICLAPHTATGSFPADLAVPYWMDAVTGVKGDKGDKGEVWPPAPTPRTANFNVVAATDDGAYYAVDATAGAVAGLLPDITTVPAGFSVSVVKHDASANAVALTPFGANTINGLTTLSLPVRGAYAVAVSNGAQWIATNSAATLPFALPLPVNLGGTGATTVALARTALGLGTAAVLNAGAGANQVVQRDGAGNIPGVTGSLVSAVPVPVAEGGTAATSAPAARTNLGIIQERFAQLQVTTPLLAVASAGQVMYTFTPTGLTAGNVEIAVNFSLNFRNNAGAHEVYVRLLKGGALLRRFALFSNVAGNHQRTFTFMVDSTYAAGNTFEVAMEQNQAGVQQAFDCYMRVTRF